MSRWNTKISMEQREEIIQAYLRDKTEGAALAMQLGLAEDYAYKLARERGLLSITRYRPKVSAPSTNPPWTGETLGQLRYLAVTMRYAHLIAVSMGRTQRSIVVAADRNGIDVIRRSPEQETDIEANRRARELRKNKNRAAKKAACAVEPIRVQPGTSKTSVVYRNQLPRIDDCMSKDRLRAMIAEACANTAEMQAI